MNMPNPMPISRALRMSDPWLPMTISRAAIELDIASRGKSVGFEATRLFAKFLHESFQQEVGSTGAQAVWLDANTVDVVGQALVEFEGAGKVRTVEDVFKYACALVLEMEKAPEKKSQSDLDRLRRFCVAFGNSLLAHRAALKHEGPINPHRR